MMDRSVEALARRILELERQVSDRTPQLGNSSLEAAAILEHDLDGNLVASYGRQWDGTSGAVAYNGPPPPQPSTPTVTPGVSSVVVSWDGLWAVAGEVAPMDFSRVEVHVSQDPNFDAAYADNLVGTIESPRGGRLTVSTGTDYSTRYVRLVARTFSGKSSVPSGISSGTPDSSVETTLEKSRIIYSTRYPDVDDVGQAGDLWHRTDPVRTDLVLDVFVSRGGLPGEYGWQRTTLSDRALASRTGAALGDMDPYPMGVTGVSLNLGSGAVRSGLVARIGHTVFVSGELIIGAAGFAAGSGRWSFDLPYPAAVIGANTLLGVATANGDAGTSTHGAGFATVRADDPTKVWVYVPSSAGGVAAVVGGTGANVTPGGAAWAAGGYVRFNLTYTTSAD